jgi:hypothetical protein
MDAIGAIFEAEDARARALEAEATRNKKKTNPKYTERQTFHFPKNGANRVRGRAVKR